MLGKSYPCPARILHDGGVAWEGLGKGWHAEGRVRLKAKASAGADGMFRRAIVASLGAGAAVCAATAMAGPIDEMSGYWSGSGTVLLSNGNTERVKCAVTYKIDESGQHVRQSMRCAAADYHINASAELSVRGAQVSGSWEEKTYSAVGQVSGRYSDSAMSLSIEGANFTATMNLSLSTCKQSISISPKGLDVRRISITLAKC